ncbi:hypothetical protein Tco_1324249 [Tanacetum coccineum]
MRPRRLLRLLSDLDCKIRYHPEEASVAADALRRNERAKPLKVRALMMTINSNLPPQIHKAQVESLKTEKVKDENLHGMDKEFENRLDRALCIRRRSWLPRVRDLGELIKHESYKSNYFIHPGSYMIYHNLKRLYQWPEHRSRHRHQKYPIGNGKI